MIATATRCAKVYRMYLIMGLVIFVLCALCTTLYIKLHETEQVNIEALAYISVADARIVDFERQLKEAKETIDAQAFEKSISRGTERTATVTAYTWTGQKTASGTWPKEGRTVAAPRNIPFGTVVWIEGIGERTVEDRTHSRYDGRYDVYMDSEAECIEWGIQQRVVR